MTEDDVALVKESWARVLPIADVAMGQFYRQLFASDAGLARHFSQTNMAVQQSRLASAIDLVVSDLHQPEVLARPLEDLGARHADYDIAERDFQAVGEALLSTLAVGLAGHWTKAHHKAWTAAWRTIVAQVMVGFRARRVA